MPRRWLVEGPGGRQFEIESDGPDPPTQAELDQLFGSQPAMSGSGEISVEDGPNLWGKAGSFLEKVGHVLGSPGDATATAINTGLKGGSLGESLAAGWEAFKDTSKNTTTGDDIFETLGMEDTVGRAGAGLAWDLVVDPLNFVGGMPVKALSKMVGPSKLLEKATGSGELVGGASRLLSEAGKKIENLPIIDEALQRVLPYAGLGSVQSKIDPSMSYRDIRRLADSTMRHSREATAQEVEKIFAGLDSAQRSKIALGMDNPALAQGWTPEMTTAAQKARMALDDQVALDKMAGSLPRDLKVSPNYVPKYPTEFDNPNPSTPLVLHGRVAQDSLQKPGYIQNWASLEEAAEKGGALTDAQEIVGKRLAAGRAANMNIDFVADAVRHFGTREPQKGYRVLNPTRIDKVFPKELSEKLIGVHFPEKVARDLERASILFSKTGELEKFARGTSKLWKTLALSTPAHQFVNFLGNMANMHLGGMALPKIMKNYSKAMTHAVDISKEVLPKFKVKGFDDGAILEALKKYEIVGTATQLGELSAERNVSRMFTGKYNPLNADFPWYKTLRKGGQTFVEEPARIAYFLDRLEKGDTIEKAALKTKEVLFDYGELTDAERKLRANLIPFYTWMRKNLPFQIKTALTSPERTNRQFDLLQFFEAAGNGDEMVQPEYLTESGYVPSPEGGGQMMRFALPLHDLGMIPAGPDIDSVQNSLRRVGGMVAPWAKLLPELAFDQEVSSGIPIRRSSGYANPAPAARLLDAVTPSVFSENVLRMADTPTGRKQGDVASYVMRQIPGFSWQARMIPGEQTDDLARGNELDTWNRVVGNLTGFNPRIITPEQQLNEQERRVQRWRERIRQTMEP